MNLPSNEKQNQILTGCIVISMALHVAFIAFLQTHSLWFYSSIKTQNFSSVTKQAIEKKGRDKILQEAFAPQKSEKQASVKPKPIKEEERWAASSASYEIPDPPQKQLSVPPFPIENLLASNRDLFPVRSFPLPSVEQIDLFTELRKNFIVPNAPVSTRTIKPRSEPSFTPLLVSHAAPIANIPTIAISFSTELTNPSPLNPDDAIGRALPQISMPDLPRLPSLADLDTANLSQFFESDIVFLPRDDGPGYIFALTLVPRPDLKLPKFRHHVTFLIDRSNSVQKDRLSASKQAVQKALEELFTDDTFNVFVFDSKVEKLFPTLMEANSDTLAKADTFLDQIQLGSFFTPADPYRPLLLTVPSQVQDDELYSAILITDGESLAKKTTQRSILHHWTEQNNGRVALYTIAMGADNHLATLDAASVFNKGKLTYATTNRGLRRKLLKLMKMIRSPVAKNMTIKAISKSPSGSVELYPKTGNAPHLFLDQPYVIIGTADNLDDFVLFVQGRLKNQWLNIKKTISFVNAKKGGNTLKAEWALQKAYRKYEQYVLDDNPQHLVEARALLEPFDLQTAFE